MDFRNKKIGVISLGCDKNRVDAEKALALIKGFGEITNDVLEAEIIIVNTCAFLESARKEAIDTVFECNEYRKFGKLEKLVVSGCLPQKFIGELFDELIEVDVFLGYKNYELLQSALERAYNGERVNLVGKTEDKFLPERVITTPEHYAYLKIADGCDNRCTYCLIPSIRGKYVSESMENLTLEAESLGEVKELILVAQDVTRYGEDLYGENKLVELLQRLSKLENVESIRLLYCYPERITDELISEINSNPKIVKYIDVPLQHASDRVLKLMNRRGSFDGYIKLIEKLKNGIKGVAIRSTFIAGFPSESEEDFETLKKFLSIAKLKNAGFFAYSREEGTPAYKLPNQIDEKTKKRRVKELYALQKQIVKEDLQRYKNQVLSVVCDGIDYDKQVFVGRAYFSAPDIDGKVYFTSSEVVTQGETYGVKVHKIKDYDIYGERIND